MIRTLKKNEEKEMKYEIEERYAKDRKRKARRKQIKRTEEEDEEG
jgi:hypothetical protein